MGILSGLLKLTPFGWFGGSKKKKEPTFQEILAPYLKQYSDIATKYSSAADEDYSKAGIGYDSAMKYYQNLLGGSRENLLKTLDASAITAAMDEQERQNYELAPRGGRRAATAANLGFNKFSSLNKYLQQLRGAAPEQIANLAQAFANMGQGKLSAAMGGTAGASNLLFGTEQIKQQEKDRKAALIGSIFEAIGAVAGGVAAACNTLDTWILTPKGHKQLRDINVGDRVITVLANGKFEEAKVIRKEIKKEQDIYELKCTNTMLRGTIGHVLAGAEGVELSFEELPEENPLLPMVINEDLATTSIVSFGITKLKEDVAILKLNNEKENFNYITNGLISIDADCKKE